MDIFKIIAVSSINDLPKITGVYCFYEKNDTIYIGKAINIKERVKNHFLQPSYKDNFFNKKIDNIGFIETESEIEALVLEAKLIKQYQPKFNTVWRDDKNYFYVAIAKNKEKIPYVYITHQFKIQNSKFKIQNIGPFVEGNALKKTLKFLRKIFPYYTSANHPKNNCTWCHLDLCPGPNPDIAEYKKNIKKLSLILQGQRKNVLYRLKKEMEIMAKEQKFEEASKIRDKIFALQQIIEHARVIEPKKITDEDWGKTNNILQAILKTTASIHRIECYDISNIQGKQAVGSMVVFENGVPEKSQYKKFRIKMENKPNDIAMLKEILQRRLAHPEWPYPEVILIDGGIAQLNIGIRTKNNYLEKLTAADLVRHIKNIKMISIAKGRRELFIEGQEKQPILLKNLPQEIYNLIVYLDDEAHRFAITYHKKLRKNALLPNG